MIETEVLVEIHDSFEKAQHVLAQFEYCGTKRTIDTYYYDPLRNNLKPYSDGKLYASFRIRQKARNVFVTYKNDHYSNGLWQFSDEYEVKINNFSSFKSIVENLGFKQLLILESEKHFYKFGDYEIVLELVKNLGIFLEVELKREINATQVASFKEQILQFIRSLDLLVSSELNSGKPELYIRKNNLSFEA